MTDAIRRRPPPLFLEDIRHLLEPMEEEERGG